MEDKNAANEKPGNSSLPIDGIRRSSRIRNEAELRTPTKRRCANEGGIDDEPTTSKKVISKSVAKKNNGKKNTNPKNEDSDALKPIIDEKICYFDRLPQMVKDMIFSELVYSWKGEYNPNFRLVCKSWYDTCSRKKSITFTNNDSIRGGTVFLGNCGYEQLYLVFEYDAYEKDVTNVNYIPRPFWEKIGSKIQLLQFSHCWLGDQVMKSVILYCDNLKYLDVSLKTGNLAQSFCSVNALKALQVVRPNLETLEMRTIFQDDPWVIPQVRSELNRWNKILGHIIRIFPNITRFIFGHSGNRLRYAHKRPTRPSFTLDFSKIEEDEVDELNLISSLAYSLSGNERNWKNALEALAKIRLTAVALSFERSHFSREDKTALINLFSNQKKLNSVSVGLSELNDEFDPLIDKEILRSVFLAIVNNSPELRQLGFHSSTEHFDWMNNDLCQLVNNPANLEEFATGSIKLKSQRLVYDSNWIDQPLMDWIPKFCYILHLTITDSVPDDFLQCIFQHMISLKSLNMCLENKKNTDFALTGRRDDGTQTTSSGYSINRLRNLERLKIEWASYVEPGRMIIASNDRASETDQNEEVTISDAVLYEFDFPKVQHLKCFLPKESSTYTEMALKMPSLTKIQFNPTSNDISLSSLMNFVQLTRKLHTFEFPVSDFQPSEAQKIFDACPSLRYLHTKSHIDFYDPTTKEVHRVLQGKYYF